MLPLVEPILDHIRDVITGKENLDFLVAWLAQQVQAPTDTTRVAIVLQGEQDVGKNIIFDFYIDKVLGAISLLVSPSSASSYSILVKLTSQQPTECWPM